MKSKYDYNVALSFAGEQRDYVREVAKVLVEEYNLRVFFDEFEEEKLWGKNLYDYLYEIYSQKSEYVIIFVSKEYKEKIWTNHERQAAQEKALQLKNQEYILPVKFDDTKIPGLSSTIKYLDAKKYSPYQIALFFVKKVGLKPKHRWFGVWEKERIKRALKGNIEIYKVTKNGFYFNIYIYHGVHIGEFENQFAMFISQYEAVSKIEECEKCKLRFTMLNQNLYIQEENCFMCHGIKAHFDGKYILKKDSFYGFEKLNDNILSKLYKLLDYEGFYDFEMCFSDYLEKKEHTRYLLYGKVPGMFPYYNGCLILENDKIRGFFINCDVEEDTIFWFASDDIIDKELQDFIKENKQFKNFKIKKFKRINNEMEKMV